MVLNVRQPYTRGLRSTADPHEAAGKSAPCDKPPARRNRGKPGRTKRSISIEHRAGGGTATGVTIVPQNVRHGRVCRLYRCIGRIWVGIRVRIRVRIIIYAPYSSTYNHAYMIWVGIRDWSREYYLLRTNTYESRTPYDDILPLRSQLVTFDDNTRAGSSQCNTPRR